MHSFTGPQSGIQLPVLLTLDRASVDLHGVLVPCKALFDQVASLPACRARYLVQRQPGGLHAPEDTPMPDVSGVSLSATRKRMACVIGIKDERA